MSEFFQPCLLFNVSEKVFDQETEQAFLNPFRPDVCVLVFEEAKVFTEGRPAYFPCVQRVRVCNIFCNAAPCCSAGRNKCLKLYQHGAMVVLFSIFYSL